MRVRLSLLPPFRESKILLPLPSEVTTISELRRHLVRSLAAISSVMDHARELVLEIDGFELLGGSGVGVIEEKDVVCVRAAAGSSKPDPSQPVRAAKKRKSRRSSLGEIAPAPAKRARKSTARTSTSTPMLVSAARPQEVAPNSAAPAPARIPIATRKRAGSGSSSVSSLSSVSSSSSDSSSSSSAASSSSSDSDASSSSSSSSSSASSSSAASSASERPAKLTGTTAFSLPPSSITTNTHALGIAPPPPGQGKPETHNRNLRRRKARQMKKLASEQAQQSAQPPTTSPLAVIPNGLASTHDALPHNRMEGIHVLATTTPTNPGLQMPKEMANRNKRKGFFKEMNALQGTRTVFSDQAAAAAAAAVAVVSGRRLEDGEHEEHGVHGDGTPRRVKQLALVGVHTPMTSTPTTTPGTTPRTAILPRIVPPSEKVLPSNVFVTSREFERVRPPRDVVNGYANGVDRATEEAEAGEAGEAEEYQAGVQAEEVQAGVQAEDDEAMWSRVEQSWDRLPVLISEELGHFKQGTLVAWKELELDLNTFSPELKLHIARVTAVSTDGLVQLDRLKRPVSEDEVWGEYEPGVIGVEEETVLKLSKADVMAGAGKWRVVPSLSV